MEFETDNEDYQEKLEEYYDEDFQVFLQEMVEGASQKAIEYCFARTTSDDKLEFQVADSIKIIPIYDDQNNLKRILRYYNKGLYKDTWITELFGQHNFEDGQPAMVTYAEIWDENQVWFFVATQDQAFKFDMTQNPNPRPHVMATVDSIDDDGNEGSVLLQRSMGTIPFYRLQNNSGERTDLELVKALIDDYDIMNCFMSNNLQDFAEAIYVVSGAQNIDVSEMRFNIKNKKVVGVPENGDVTVNTVQIPTAGREAKMALDMQNIYKFGMGFDSAAIGDGNITNIVIKSRYTLLKMKANKCEVRLQSMLKWINQLVTMDINRRYGTAFNPQDVTFTFTCDVLENDVDKATIESTEATAKQTMINAILAAAPKIDSESVIQLICDQFDLSFDEVKGKLDTEDYQDITQGTDQPTDNSLSDSSSNSISYMSENMV